MPAELMSSVCPSASARATTSAPTFPPAPGRFSTITGCPSERCNRSPTALASTSASPPGANGATIFTGFDGYAPCAPLPAAASAAMIAAPIIRMVFIRRMVMPGLRTLRWGQDPNHLGSASRGPDPEFLGCALQGPDPEFGHTIPAFLGRNHENTHHLRTRPLVHRERLRRRQSRTG